MRIQNSKTNKSEKELEACDFKQRGQRWPHQEGDIWVRHEEEERRNHVVIWKNRWNNTEASAARAE